MHVKKFWCRKCGRKIKKRDYPWCELCRLEEYQKGRVKTKSKNNMNFKLQDEEKPAEAGTEEAPEETPEETPETDTDPEKETTE